ncbi:tRNA lysidine(34) synthetase TilS [Prevotella sp. A2931]|uniref:tRNA(Ile)-lysidine synthase n=1 Tax=Prevotella illustrans TaxID=2800387 RepID=A0ABS3M3H0_9BACT|nr:MULTISPECIES: tRNA lysidine(34) synthetase TilS [Prevotella]MBO1362675.1 tRNA lysidine(34) synthetase TilS [Prevotella illustrans]PTL25157.1 tRNA lysidine(34) synthetase TilS [Prevotella sp. oral taxon 820]
MTKFIEKIHEFIVENHLLDKDKKYLLALSGGADSVGLLTVCIQLGYTIEAVHCNFHLRGEESDRDERFCERLCSSKGIPFHCAHFSTKEYAKTHKISIEMAARDLRYKYFEQLRNDIAAEAILIAHHQDDSVETILINLIRGTGLRGLQGIKPQNGNITRPLLAVCHDEIVNYLNSIHQDYIVDSSNLVDDVQRNKLRLKILPLLRELNPSVSCSIIKTAKRIRMAVQFFDCAINDSFERVVIKRSENELRVSISALERECAQEYILFELLRPYLFSPKQVEQIALHYNSNSGQIWESSKFVLLADRNELIVQLKKTRSNKVMKIPEMGVYVYDEDQRFTFETIPCTSCFVPSKTNNVITIDLDKVSFPIFIRHCRQGDKFSPFGMKGRKLISDFLTDLKLSLFAKQQQLIVEDASGQILWVVGKRIDDHFKVTANTRKVLTIKVD